jgi:hypothetical protein
MKVASYNYELKQWIWWHKKPLAAAGRGDEVIGVAQGLDERHRPALALGEPEAPR